MIFTIIMPIFFLRQFILFAGLLFFRVATVSSPQKDSLTTPPLEPSTNFTLPSTLSTTINTSNNLRVLPSRYVIPASNPPVILKINPTSYVPIGYMGLTQTVVFGLEALVQDTIRSHGDIAIPEGGTYFVSDNVVIAVRSHRSGTLDMTNGIVATVLRGIWEITLLYHGCKLDLDVYVGRQDEAQHRGHVDLFLRASPSEAAS